MSDVHTIIKFDGPALAGHAMDVAHLAPALLALSEVVKTANKRANGDRAGVRVLVSADLDQHCFELNIDLVLTIWEQAKMLVSHEEIKSAKDIAEWLGLIAAPPTGLFLLIKHLKGKKVASVAAIRVGDGKDLVEIRVEGEGEPILVAQAVYELYADVATRAKAVAVMAPLREPGYDTLEFYNSNGVFVHIEEDDVPAEDGRDLPEVVPQNVNRSVIRAGVKIRKPAYEGRSKWTVMYKRAVEAAFEDIEWLAEFQSGKVAAPPGSYLDVDLSEEYITNENGEMVGDPSYVITKVYGVTPPSSQPFMDFGPADS